LFTLLKNFFKKYNILKRLSIIVFILLISPLFLFSETNLGKYHFKTIRISAQSNHSAISTKNVIIISKREIKESGSRTVAEVINGKAGLHIEKQGGLSQTSKVSMRGISGTRVLILLDGIPQNLVSDGSVNLGVFDLANIDRIEIIKGGNSARFGSNAIGGVINIITKKTSLKNNNFSGSISYGSFATFLITQKLDLTLKNLILSLDYSGGKSEGGYSFQQDITITDSGEHELAGDEVKYLNTGFYYHYLNLSGKQTLSYNNWKIDYTLQYKKREAGIPGTIEFPTIEATQKDESLSFSWQLAGQKLLQKKNDDFYLRFFLIKRDKYYQDFQLFTEENYHKNSSIKLDCNYKLKWKKHFLEFGFSGDYNKLESNKYGLTAETSIIDKTLGVYANSTLLILNKKSTAKLFVNPQLRLDYSYLNGTALSPGLGSILQLGKSKQFSISLNLGKSFRYPSFNDLFWPQTYFAAGNPDLKPEEVWTGDTTITWKPTTKLTFTISYFYSNFKNMIRWLPSAGGVWRPSNIGKVQIQGLEIESQKRFYLTKSKSVINLNLNYTLQYATDLTSGATYEKQLPRQPYEMANIDLKWSSANDWFAGLKANYMGFRFLNAANTKYLGDYFLLNFSAGLPILKYFSLQITLKNIFNTSYIHYLEYPVPGREIFIKCSYQF